jgi:hypothetical protein
MPGQCGAATLTVSVSDGVWTATNAFVLTVLCQPDLSSIPEQMIAQGNSTDLISFLISDPDTPVAELLVTATSDNTALVPNDPDALILAGTGAERTLQVVPIPDQCGTATITVTVSDGVSAISKIFVLTVFCRPVLSTIPDQTLVLGAATAPLPFMMDDPDTPIAELLVTLNSDNQALVPNDPSALILAGTGTDRTLQIIPVSGQCGAATITITVSDGVSSVTSTFVVAVQCSPVISLIADQTLAQGASTGLILFTVSDADTLAEDLSVTAGSDNAVLVPNTQAALVLGGSGVDRTLRILPDPLYSGLATITIGLSDGVYTVAESFTLTVEPQPELRVSALSRSSPQEWHFEFVDTGTSSTNYALEYRPELTGENGWSNLTSSPLTSLGSGRFEAYAVPVMSQTAFFRVKGFPSAITNVNFSSSGLQVQEGDGPVYLTLMFNQPFLGTLHYTVGGPDTDSIEALSGTLTVHGSTAAIPIFLRDDADIDTLKYLVLSLEAGPGYAVGASSQHTLTIEENDAEWQGQLLLPSAISDRLDTQIVYQTNGMSRTNMTLLPMNDQMVIAFVLKIIQSGGSYQGALVGDELGIFPSNEVPAQLSFTQDSFTASVQGMELPAESTLLDTPMHLSVDLAAANSGGETNVTPKEIQGAATLILSYDGLPHLTTTNSGWFQLLKPPVKPSAKEPELVVAP